MYFANARGALAPFESTVTDRTPRVERQSLVLDSRAPRAQLMGLPNGPGAVARTLQIMARLAREAVRSQSQYARLKALDIYRNAGIQARQYTQEARALQVWVQNCVRYVRDPVDVELVQTPEVTLKLLAGDCDDQSTLLAAMLTATGHVSRFVAVGMNGEPLSHVLVETKIGDKWVPAETILKKPLGWYPQGVTSRLIRPV